MVQLLQKYTLCCDEKEIPNSVTLQPHNKQLIDSFFENKSVFNNTLKTATNEDFLMSSGK